MRLLVIATVLAHAAARSLARAPATGLARPLPPLWLIGLVELAVALVDDFLDRLYGQVGEGHVVLPDLRRPRHSLQDGPRVGLPERGADERFRTVQKCLLDRDANGDVGRRRGR